MFVMPANAGIQVCFQFKFKNRLDSLPASAGMTGRSLTSFEMTNRHVVIPSGRLCENFDVQKSILALAESGVKKSVSL